MQSKSDSVKAKTPTKAGLDVEIAFYEGLRRRLPSDPDLLKLLGDAYTKVGRWEDGLAVDLELARSQPDEPLVHYNLACSYSLLERLAEAATTLERAIELGYRDRAWLSKDADLENLRNSPLFARIIRKIEGNPKPGI